VHPKYPFFLPVKVLSRVFRGKFVGRLKRAFRKKKIQFPPANAALEQPKLFLRFLRTLCRRTGSSMLSQLSVALGRYCATSADTPTVSLSATIGYWPSMVSASPSAGRITHAETSNGR
jgi:hypothetical protein